MRKRKLVYDDSGFNIAGYDENENLYSWNDINHTEVDDSILTFGTDHHVLKLWVKGRIIKVLVPIEGSEHFLSYSKKIRGSIGL